MTMPKGTKLDASPSEPPVWFGGVDKKLLAMNTTPDKKLVEASDKTLTTEIPLPSLDNPNILIKPSKNVTDELALDCEMVECYNSKSVLARISIVNLFGQTIMDQYVAPPAKVTDYRTKYSGIRRKDLVDAPRFEQVQAQVVELLKDKVVVGHALHNDFDVLNIHHPSDRVRDTSKFFRYLFQGKTPSLKKLCESVLAIKIQKGEHDSIQDAQATMKLYTTERINWLKRYSHASVPGEGPSSVSKIGRRKGVRIKTKPQKKKRKTFYVKTLG